VYIVLVSAWKSAWVAALKNSKITHRVIEVRGFVPLERATDNANTR
jgi:hypothetical protein